MDSPVAKRQSAASAEEALALARARLRWLAAPHREPLLIRHRVRRVILVASASRAGSSLLAEALRGFSEFMHLQGELTPLLAACELGAPLSGEDSDALGTTRAGKAAWFGEQLDFDACSAPADSPARSGAIELFTRRLVWRLTAQWPTQHFEPDEIRSLVDAAAARLSEEDSSRWPAQKLFHTRLLARLRETHASIRPEYYDGLGDPGPASAPPSPCILEEPPFVCVRPWRPRSGDEVEKRPLIVKGPSAIHKLDFLRDAFPRASFEILHLVRRAEPSIVGLINGWLHRGFHAHRFHVPLQIEGYADNVPFEERHWWKFDFPPGWRDHLHDHLVDVSAFQWESAHRAILETIERHKIPFIRIAFERLIAPGGAGLDEAAPLQHWLGLAGADRLAHRLRGLPHIMATRRATQVDRWVERIREAGSRPDIREIARRLGDVD
jgi:hypothetical protein